MLKRLMFAGALACSCAGTAIATPIPASTPLIQESLVVAKVSHRHTPAGHVPRHYMIFASMSAVVALVAAAVISD